MKNNNSTSQSFSVSQRIYAGLLRAYPRRHREEYGAAMAQLFRDQCRDAWNESRGWGMAKLWLRVLPDLVNTSIMERLAALNERKSMSARLAGLSSFQNPPARIFFKVFVAVFLVVLIANVAITFLLPETYASTCRIKVENDAVGGFNGNTITDAMKFSDPYFIQTTFEIMQSQLVLSNVIASLDLNTKWGKIYNNGSPLQTAETMKLLRQRLQLAPVRNTKLVSITFYSDDKNEAAQIANAIAESYRDYRVHLRAELASKSLGAMQEQYQSEGKQIGQIQGALDSLRQQFKITDDGSNNQSPQDKPYWDEKNRLTSMQEAHQLLAAKIEAEKMNVQIPQPVLVQVADRAEPGHTPVKPNKPLNIVLGAFEGILAASVLGAIAALVVFQIRKRSQRQNALA
jgi:uncharacterized protein involved in exopolysaccharide biosynthesis